MQPNSASVATVPGNPDAAPVFDGAVQDEKAIRVQRYSSPEFTRQLLEHMHEAKKAALRESVEPLQ